MTEDFLNNIKEFGREVDALIQYQVTDGVEIDEITIDAEDIYKLSFIFNTDLFKTIMTRVEVETKVELPINTNLDFYFGILVNGAYEYVYKGTYKIVEQPTYNADTRTYTAMAYDGMVEIGRASCRERV